VPHSRNTPFSKFFSETHTALRRYVQRFVVSRESAEEIAQEAFLRTYEQGDRVDSPRAFLFSTARNLAFNANRARRTAKTDSVGDFDDLRVLSTQTSCEESALEDEESRLIRNAVERLPPQCRAAFSLRVFHECSYKEIADRMGISTKTVEKYIARGLHEVHRDLRRRYSEANPLHD
jgi:RNA polymerase sigma factor (sigma-70 family)